MKIWWCEEHQCSTDTFGTDCYKGRRADFQNCAMVEMQLVPADAELQCPNCKFVYEATNV